MAWSERNYCEGESWENPLKQGGGGLVRWRPWGTIRIKLCATNRGQQLLGGGKGYPGRPVCSFFCFQALNAAGWGWTTLRWTFFVFYLGSVFVMPTIYISSFAGKSHTTSPIPSGRSDLTPCRLPCRQTSTSPSPSTTSTPVASMTSTASSMLGQRSSMRWKNTKTFQSN